MSVNGIYNHMVSGYTPDTQQAKTTKKASEETTNETGVTYEKTSDKDVTDTSKKTYTLDADTVSRLKMELKSKTNELSGIVEKLLGNQAKRANSIYDLMTGIKNGTVTVDAATAAKAKEDISEDGYWGVNKTSDRLVEMAKALSGGDSSKADTMIAAIKKGFDQATKAWGDKLPDISSQTVDAAVQKLNDWKASFNTAD